MAYYCLDASFVQDLYWKNSGYKEPRVMLWNDQPPESAFEQLYEVFQFVVRNQNNVAIAFWKRLNTIFPQFPRGNDYFGWTDKLTPKVVCDSLRLKLIQGTWEQYIRRESAPRLRREFNELEVGYNKFLELYTQMLQFRTKLIEAVGDPSAVVAGSGLLTSIKQCAKFRDDRSG